MAKKTTKKKQNTEFRVRQISNGYTVIVWDTDNYTEDKVTFCHDRDSVLDLISELVF